MHAASYIVSLFCLAVGNGMDRYMHRYTRIEHIPFHITAYSKYLIVGIFQGCNCTEVRESENTNHKTL